MAVATGLLVLPLLAPGFMGWYGALIGAICCVAGTLGDLKESMVKRSCGIKDMSNIMPGHGGIIDRLDSMLLIAPVVAALVTLSTLF